MIKTKIINSDTLTAILAFKRLKGERKSLLEGAAKDTESGRYSIIAVNPIHHIKVYGKRYIIDGCEKIVEDPLKEIFQFVASDDFEKLNLPFESGAIGYVGYDVISCYENLGEIPEETRDIPDIQFYVYESFIVLDHKNETITLIQDNYYSKRSEEELEKALMEMEKSIKTPLENENDEINFKPIKYKSNYTKDEYMKMVEKAKKYIQEGDIFQVVLSQRLEADFNEDAFDYYRKLRTLNPSPYLFYIDFDETKIIGSSPESLIKAIDRTIITNPIAGTRKRGNTKEEDENLANDLLTDEKELAEHRMLVDLGRNDIGKVAVTGSVRVPVYLKIERYRFLMHLVSVVDGTLKEDLNTMDALKSVMPAGTVSGAPKIRAMQRIYQWENVKRGPYGGAVGYLTKRGNLDFALAIRTMVVHKNKAYVQAGAGIVYDSNPESEYFETLQKAKALLEVGNDFTNR